MRRLLTRFFRFALAIFYRRIDVVGLERVPLGEAVVFAANHPNGLVDPLFILCFAPRPVSFLAKAPLFRYPVIGWFTRAFDSIPVYRKQDRVAGSNRETFARAREILSRGGGIAIFPEGTTHSDPQLRELKTGAARIALGASLERLSVVPVGIDYTAKQTFRSDALVLFGEAIAVEPHPLDESGEPPAAAVEALTEAINRGLAEVTLQTDSIAALELITKAEAIFSGGETSLGESFELRRRFIDGYHLLRERDPERVGRIAAMIENAPARTPPRWRTPLLPLAVIGAVLHYPAYRAVDALAKRFAKNENELQATIKFLAALLLFPLTWIVIAVAIGARYGILAAAAAILLQPLLGGIAMRVFEDAGAPRVGGAEAIRSEIARVAEEIGGA
jgi:1-acyl-sn-glycerol-3-phosphate acyltransferase